MSALETRVTLEYLEFQDQFKWLANQVNKCCNAVDDADMSVGPVKSVSSNEHEALVSEQSEQLSFLLRSAFREEKSNLKEFKGQISHEVDTVLERVLDNMTMLFDNLDNIIRSVIADVEHSRQAVARVINSIVEKINEEQDDSNLKLDRTIQNIEKEIADNTSTIQTSVTLLENNVNANVSTQILELGQTIRKAGGNLESRMTAMDGNLESRITAMNENLEQSLT